MRVSQVWIRFYKSFNFDYELKANPKGKRLPWQETQTGWMPHVCVDLEADVTAVVGANESGKTHLLDALEIVLTGEKLYRRDFCRYSTLFSVEIDSRLYPEVGATLVPTDAEGAALAKAKIPIRRDGTVLMLRPAPGKVDVVGINAKRIGLDEEQITELQGLLPFPQWLKTNVALPDSVSISTLSGKGQRFRNRHQRIELLSFLAGLGTAENVVSEATTLFGLLDSTDVETEEEELGRTLLTKVARIDASSFTELESAITEGREGLVNGLIQEMNNSIARHLNVSRWWTQDPDFELRLSPRENELVFTIRDRTGTDYSFSERSKGLTYFLSYYVQLLSHQRSANQTEVLLMDEPDAFLSAAGQQDLLRVLEHHARPDNSERRDQVVYVTHSPFLLNRNAAHRIRVVDKGTRDEGTRLVKDPSQNHYEPLRTSLGAFIAETAFIGGENLFVEGVADQVLIAGMNSRLLKAGAPPSQCLDLNRVTLVACGSNIPYMLYLARGRNQIKPACAVLLDSDQSGEEARKQIRRAGPHRKPSVPDELIVMVAEWAAAAGISPDEGVVVREPEDLVPTSIAALIARRYAKTMLGASEKELKALDVVNIRDALEGAGNSLWDALDGVFVAAFDTKMNKAGFAKELIAYLDESESAPNRPAYVPALDARFGLLLSHLSMTLDRARDRESERRRDRRLERIIEAFVADHPTGAVRDAAITTLNRIDGAMDDTRTGDMVRAETARIRRDYKLAADPLRNVEQYDDFLQRLTGLRLIERLESQGLLTSNSLENHDEGGKS